MYLAKDFIETQEGLRFAVVEGGLEQGRVLCFLRYIKKGGNWQKLATEQANALLKAECPDYLYYSAMKDTFLHAVPEARILDHYQPRSKLSALMAGQASDPIEQDLIQLCNCFLQQGLNINQFGVTGSLLIGAQQPQSDIDLVVYDRKQFHSARTIIRQLIGENILQALSEQDWRDCYQRRACALSLEDYTWHERRKFNKAIVNGRKFDLNLLDQRSVEQPVSYKKQGSIRLTTTISDDRWAFDYPSIFKIDHRQISKIVSYTATYTGQAFNGEQIEVSGLLEQAENGHKRIVVGSSREADGEYIRVIAH